MTAKETTTDDLLAFMQEHMATKQDLAQQKHEILDHVDRKIADLENRTNKRMDDRFDRMDDRFDKMDDRFDRMDDRFDRMDDRFDKMDDRFDVLTSVLHERDLISDQEVKKIQSLKPLIV